MPLFLLKKIKMNRIWLYLILFPMIISIPTMASTQTNWTGTTNQNRPISFSVSDNRASDINIEVGINCGFALVTVKSKISEAIIYGSKFETTLKTSACNPTQPWKTESICFYATFTNAYTCEGTWNFSGGGSGTWQAEADITATVITRHPISKTVSAGKSATFIVEVDGVTPSRYQWQKDDMDIANATSSILSIPRTIGSDEGSYRCLISSTTGELLSNVATLNIVRPGDVNDDGSIDMEDSLTTLKICTEKNSIESTESKSDMDGNGKIGLPEGIYALQQSPSTGPSDENYVLRQAAVTIDGNKSDWAGIQPAIIDAAGDRNINAAFSGSDLLNTYLAKDSSFLYIRMEISNNEKPYKNDCMTYFFVARQDPSQPDTSGDYAGLVSYNGITGSWIVSTQQRNEDGTIKKIKDSYPLSYSQFGAGFLEFKVPLADMGELNGTFPRAYTHAHGCTYPPIHEASDDSFSDKKLINR